VKGDSKAAKATLSGLNRFQAEALQAVERAWSKGKQADGSWPVLGLVLPTGSGKTLVEGLLPYAAKCKGEISSLSCWECRPACQRNQRTLFE
jgi:hypothetical protein